MSDIVRVFLLGMCMYLSFKLGVHYAYSKIYQKMLNSVFQEIEKICEKLGIPIPKKQEPAKGIWEEYRK